MIYQFGDCTLDTNRDEVRRAGELINTEPQALKVLRHLLDHRDRGGVARRTFRAVLAR